MPLSTKHPRERYPSNKKADERLPPTDSGIGILATAGTKEFSRELMCKLSSKKAENKHRQKRGSCCFGGNKFEGAVGGDSASGGERAGTIYTTQKKEQSFWFMEC